MSEKGCCCMSHAASYWAIAYRDHDQQPASHKKLQTFWAKNGPIWLLERKH